MDDLDKTRKHLVIELTQLRQRMAELEVTATQHKQAQEALQVSETQYRRLFEAAKDGILILDAETGKITAVNPFLTNLLGYAEKEILGQKLWEIGPFKDIKISQIAFQELQSEEYIRYEDLPLETRDGRSIAVEFISNVYLSAHKKVIQCNIRDITERKRAEAQLRLQSAALNAAANAIVITDRAGFIQWVNPAFSELTGYTAAEALGKNPRELVKSGQHDQAFYKDLWDTILSGQVWRGEIINRRKDGTLYTEEQVITPLRDVHDEISHFIAVKQNITTRQQLEAQNQKLTEQFYQAQKLDSIGQLAGGIAHDFNNMLVPILGYAELAQAQVAPDTKLYAYLNQIKDAGRRAADLTRQILVFSRQQMLEMKPLDLNPIISQFEPMLRRLIGEDIDLQIRLTANLPPLKADKGQLEQVLLNLVVNARDAMPAGGTLVIETGQVVLDEAYVAQHIEAQPGPQLVLAVSDTGQGMDAVTQQRIFEPFFTTKSRGQGTGLGLATVFGIVKQHGGSIWVYSELGRGTTFKIYLPLAESPVPAAEPELPEAGSLGGTETVLLVEDEASVRQLVGETLGAYGYRVLETGEPEQSLALAAAHEGPIHLLLTDIIMPQMDGLKLYRQLVLSHTGLKVLYMSGYTDNIIAYHHVLDEATAFLQKPFTLHSLLQRVRAVLGKPVL